MKIITRESVSIFQVSVVQCKAEKNGTEQNKSNMLMRGAFMCLISFGKEYSQNRLIVTGWKRVIVN